MSFLADHFDEKLCLKVIGQKMSVTLMTAHNLPPNIPPPIPNPSSISSNSIHSIRKQAQIFTNLFCAVTSPVCVHDVLASWEHRVCFSFQRCCSDGSHSHPLPHSPSHINPFLSEPNNTPIQSSCVPTASL